MKKFIQTLGLAIILVIVTVLLGAGLVQVLREIAAPPPLPISLTQ